MLPQANVTLEITKPLDRNPEQPEIRMNFHEDLKELSRYMPWWHMGGEEV
jgi:hypothetical protein